MLFKRFTLEKLTKKFLDYYRTIVRSNNGDKVRLATFNKIIVVYLEIITVYDSVLLLKILGILVDEQSDEVKIGLILRDDSIICYDSRLNILKSRLSCDFEKSVEVTLKYYENNNG